MLDLTIYAVPMLITISNEQLNFAMALRQSWTRKQLD